MLIHIDRAREYLKYNLIGYAISYLNNNRNCSFGDGEMVFSRYLTFSVMTLRRRDKKAVTVRSQVLFWRSIVLKCPVIVDMDITIGFDQNK